MRYQVKLSHCMSCRSHRIKPSPLTSLDSLPIMRYYIKLRHCRSCRSQKLTLVSVMHIDELNLALVKCLLCGNLHPSVPVKAVP